MISSTDSRKHSTWFSTPVFSKHLFLIGYLATHVSTAPQQPSSGELRHHVPHEWISSSISRNGNSSTDIIHACMQAHSCIRHPGPVILVYTNHDACRSLPLGKLMSMRSVLILCSPDRSSPVEAGLIRRFPNCSRSLFSPFSSLHILILSWLPAGKLNTGSSKNTFRMYMQV